LQQSLQLHLNVCAGGAFLIGMASLIAWLGISCLQAPGALQVREVIQSLRSLSCLRYTLTGEGGDTAFATTSQQFGVRRAWQA
jgi:hypothetical protein